MDEKLKNIAVIGAGVGPLHLATSEIIRDRGIIINPPLTKDEEEKLVEDILPLPSYIDLTYHKASEMPSIYGNKQFICKGKHRYENDGKGNFVCQCGRNVND